MKEVCCNLWDHGLASTGAPSAICITTNGTVKANGSAVMGRGCALEAAQIYPGIAAQLGSQIEEAGNNVQIIRVVSSVPIVAFPVKYAWHERADLDLIARSARSLVELIACQGWREVLLPRPGCGNGQRDWEREVRPILLPILDDRVVVVYK